MEKTTTNILVEGSDSKLGVVGLENLANTGYMNCSLQCLSQIKELTQFFLTDEYLQEINTKNPLGMGGKLANEYAALLKNLWFGTSSSYAPKSMKMTISQFNPKFAGFQQHDALEFLYFMIDGLHEDLNRVLVKPFVDTVSAEDQNDKKWSLESWKAFLMRNQSIIVDNLYGQYKSQITCLACSFTSTIFEPFSAITLPLPVNKDKPNTLSIYECFEHFGHPVQVSGEDAWYCSQCKAFQTATKKTYIYKTPQTLIIQFKRADNSFSKTEKIQEKIDFPVENLNIGKYVMDHKSPMDLTNSELEGITTDLQDLNLEGDAKIRPNLYYDLMAVINHDGSLSHGHYTACTKNYRNNKWYSFEDTKIAEQDADKLCTSSAYILFYTRK